MQNLKFFTLLRTLQAAEVPAFHKYLKQMHGREDIALEVFEYIKKFYPGFRDDKKLDIAYAYRKVFGADISAQDSNRTRMLNALSDLHLWLKDFLLTEKVLHDALVNKTVWLAILQERGLKTEFSKQAAGLYTDTITIQKDTNGYLKEIAPPYLQYQNLSQNRKSPDIVGLQRCMDELKTSSETILLKMDCEIANMRKVRPSVSGSNTAVAVKRHAENPSVLEWYREVFQLIDTEEEKHYNRLEMMMLQHANTLDPGDLHGIIIYMHNYAATQIRNGKEVVYRIKLHEMNKIALQHGFFSQKGTMSATQFTNIVNVACAVQEFEWAESFIEQQNHMIPGDIREDTRLLANALLLFEQEHFKKVLLLLKPTEFKHIHYIIRSRSLILRSYLELAEDPDIILDYCAAFEAFLRRHRKPKTGAVEATLAFIKVFKMLLLQKVEKQAILDRIEKMPSIYFKAWLEKKAGQYKPRYPTRKQKGK